MKLFSVVALLVGIIGGLSASADQDKFTCYSKFVADAGYYLVLQKNEAGQLQVKLAEESFVGARPLHTFDVNYVNQLDGAEYRDIETDGKNFTLVIDFNKIEGQPLNGVFHAIVDGVQHPTENFPEWGNLYCMADESLLD